jgi:hypothetical protein
MPLDVIYPNHLRERRLRAGVVSPRDLAALAQVDEVLYEQMESGALLPTLEELDRIRRALGDVAAADLYMFGLLNTIGGTQLATHDVDYADFYQRPVDGAHLLVSRQEAGWIEGHVKPDRAVDVFVNMSCATQLVPHLILDTMSILETLGVSFAAGAGRLFCCGSYYRGNRDTVAAARMNQAAVARSKAWGAKTTVHWCTQCQNTFTDFALRKAATGQPVPDMDNVQVLTFLYDLLRHFGQRVPWKREVRANVLVHGIDISPVHRDARQKVADILQLVPGVTVVGIADETFPPQSQLDDKNKDVVIRTRAEIAAYAAARGADTISSQHQGGHIRLARFAGAGIAIRHCVSIVAAALGCDHPDRYQAASLLGDAKKIADQTRVVWQSWGMDEAKALTSARKLFDPAHSLGSSQCTCGGQGGECREQLISVDVLDGWPRASSIG